MKSNVPSVIEVSGRFEDIDQQDEKKENEKDNKDEESLLLLKKGLPEVTTDFESFEVECPKCKKMCNTDVSIYFSDAAWIICIIFFFLCLPCFCWIPFCLGKKRYKLLRDCQHRCPDPECRHLIAHQYRG